MVKVAQRMRVQPRLMLVDGHSVAFRAYHALPRSIQGNTGRPANALYGFINILFRVLQDQQPTHLGVAFDVGRPWRQALFPEYKMHRAEGPEDLAPQVGTLRGLLRSFAIPISTWHLAVIVPVSFVVQMLPVSLNGFGVREATFSFYFTRLGLPIGSAMALSLGAQALVMFFSLSGAACYVVRRHPHHG